MNTFPKIAEIVRGYGLAKTIKILLASGIQVATGFLLVYLVSSLMSILLGSSENNPQFLGVELATETLLISLVVVQVIATVMSIFTEYYKARYISYLSAWLRSKLLFKTINRDYSFFVEQDTTNVQQTIYQYSGYFGILTSSIFDIIIKLAMIIVFVIAAIWQAPILCSILFSIAVVVYFTLIYCTKKLRIKISDKLSESDKSMQSLSLQILSGIKSIRISGKGERYYSHYRDAVLSYSKYDAKRPLLSLVPKYIIEGLMISSLAIYLLMMHWNQSLSSELPAVGVLVFVAFKVFPLMQSCYSQFSVISTSEYMVNRIYDEYVDQDAIIPAKKEAKFEHLIEAKELTFEYKTGNKKIKFPNFTIKKGEIVGVQGASGSGKSTLLDLLLGMYEPTSGSIYIDDRQQDSIYLRGLHGSLGYVGQDLFLLNTSIAENIAMDTIEHIDMQKVKFAAKQAQLVDFIDSLDDGYETVVGDRGVRLSGGQKQRIAIARALYGEPEILFFDEATSALDNETEEQIMNTIYNLPEGLTIVMIAHRLSTLDRVEKLIKL